ncbi:MAG: hypothetical protein M1837_006891 [Sclerophora amabilis]|nr:MAG: hypothetical protein M1837_006891 [Sclerophora amabilis]
MAPAFRRYQTDSSDSSSSSRYSESSDRTQSTAPTSYAPASRPSLKQHETAGPILSGHDRETPAHWGEDPRASTETYASTIPSEEDLLEKDPEYDVPEYKEELLAQPEAIPCTPPEFAELFPSTRRLYIRHDDSTLDGNMNLRVDTEVPVASGRKRDFTLFHLRMHDLKTRDFSLRRYCRDSGREICHSSRRYTKPAAVSRPGIQRSVSTALASIRGKHETKDSTAAGLKRHDSGYDSSWPEDEEDGDDESAHPDASRVSKGTNLPLPTNTTKLEFSNYAQVDLKRRGAKASKRYDFEYWGTSYAWKRVARKDGKFQEVSYHLLNNHGDVVAHIVPVPLTTQQAMDETAKGGWVPPCSMWISDQNILRRLSDVADVIVATGLTALVDDSIKRRFHNKNSMQLLLPVPPKSPLKMEYIGPKRLIDEVFHRRHSSHARSTPLRQISAEA